MPMPNVRGQPLARAGGRSAAEAEREARVGCTPGWAAGRFECRLPTLLTEWGRVTVTWWTHKIHALHRNDFIMAAKTDALLKG